MPNLRGLVEIVVLVSDMEKSLHFYRDVLGLKVISPEGRGPVFLQVGDHSGVPNQIVLAPRPRNAPPFPERPLRSVHHIGLEVDLEVDLEALQPLTDELARLGFEVRTGVHPFLPVEAIYIDDPDGNEIELVARKPS